MNQHLKDLYQPINPKFPFKVEYKVEWPSKFPFNGHTYYHTGKVGYNFRDNCPSAEYDDFDYGRIWLDLEGVICNVFGTVLGTLFETGIRQ